MISTIIAQWKKMVSNHKIVMIVVTVIMKTKVEIDFISISRVDHSNHWNHIDTILKRLINDIILGSFCFSI